MNEQANRTLDLPRTGLRGQRSHTSTEWPQAGVGGGDGAPQGRSPSPQVPLAPRNACVTGKETSRAGSSGTGSRLPDVLAAASKSHRRPVCLTSKGLQLLERSGQGLHGRPRSPGHLPAVLLDPSLACALFLNEPSLRGKGEGPDLQSLGQTG